MNRPEKFAWTDLQSLRNDLVAAGPDYDGAAEIIRAFLSGRGYGISPESARLAAIAFGMQGLSVDSIRTALDQAALAV